MCKEVWIESYERAIEDLADEINCEFDEAEEILNKLLEKDPSYLDGYLCGDEDAYKDY